MSAVNHYCVHGKTRLSCFFAVSQQRPDRNIDIGHSSVTVRSCGHFTDGYDGYFMCAVHLLLLIDLIKVAF